MSNLAAMLRLPANLKSTQWQILAGPILILLILSMMVLPLPAFILDLLFTFNIALSIMVLLVAMFTQRTLEFAAFPTILLFTTLLRLALNVASTRIILMEGHTGAAAAGKVVEAFGHFLVGGNFAIGIVVFVILVIINFMVITKGAGRIAEVGARFVLDGMPGKQMAIDADLNAGLIGEDEAKKRRSEVTQEADFYGSMDGASKFVRGDAIAGILIMVINVVGGLLVGVLQHGMSMGHAAESYTLLTIGDGLVAQIPALVISTAAGVIVTRVSTDQDVGEQMVNQLFSNPSVMLLSAAVLGLLGLVPGMPNLVFLLFTAGLLGLAWWIRGREQKAPAEPKPVKMAENNTVVEATWNDVQLEDSLGMEVGWPRCNGSSDSSFSRNRRARTGEVPPEETATMSGERSIIDGIIKLAAFGASTTLQKMRRASAASLTRWLSASSSVAAIASQQVSRRLSSNGPSTRVNMPASAHAVNCGINANAFTVKRAPASNSNLALRSATSPPPTIRQSRSRNWQNIGK